MPMKLWWIGVGFVASIGVANAVEISDACKKHELTRYEVDEFTGVEIAKSGIRPSSFESLGDITYGVNLKPDHRIMLAVDSERGVLIRILYVVDGGSWRFISEREPLRSLSDGTVYSHAAIPESRQAETLRLGGSHLLVMERQWYTPDTNGIAALLREPSTKFRIVGENGYVDRSMKAKAHKKLVEWARACLPKEYLP